MDCRPNDERSRAQGTAFMRTGNARTSVKPGRREETRSVGHVVRPTRLPPTLSPPDQRWRRQVRSSHARAAALRPGPDLPSWSDAHLAGDVTHPARRACVEERVRRGPSPSSCQPSDSLVARSAAAPRRRRVLVHQVQLQRAGFRSDRASLPSKRSPAGVAVEVCPLRRRLFVVGLITIFKEGVCSSRCWSMRSQVPMRR